MFREVKEEDFPALKTFLSHKLPSSLIVYSLLEMREKFGVKWQMFVSSNDRTEFIFVQGVRPFQSCCLFWDEEKLTEEEVKEYLRNIPEWSWNESFLTFCLDSSLQATVNKLICERALSSKEHLIKRRSPCVAMETTPDTVKILPLEKNYKLGELEEKHAQLVLKNWDYETGETVSSMREFIRAFPSSAVYEESDLENENPVSWAVLKKYGHIGMTYTVPEHRRKGLGSIVTSDLSRKVMEQKVSAIVTVEVGNENSVVMHEKIGFRPIRHVQWTWYAQVP